MSEFPDLSTNPTPSVDLPAKAKKKRRKAVRLDAKTVKWLEDRGWCAGIVERRHGPFSFDFKGFADILAIRYDRPFGEPNRLRALGVQVCRGAGGSRAAHREKLTVGDGAPGVREWLRQGGTVIIVGWDLRRDLNESRRGVGRETWRVTSIDEVKFAPGEEDAPMGRLEAWEWDANERETLL